MSDDLYRQMVDARASRHAPDEIPTTIQQALDAFRYHAAKGHIYPLLLEEIDELRAELGDALREALAQP